MQWWGALTKQFTELAASAMRESAREASKDSTGSQGQQAAGDGTSAPKKSGAPRAARKTIGAPARKRTKAA